MGYGIVKNSERAINGFKCEAKCISNGIEMHEKLASMARRWWCGYITVPADHPWAKFEDYNDIDANVHGGLTFGEQVRSPGGALEGVKLGFDCCHYNDPEFQGDEHEDFVWQELTSLTEQAIKAARQT